MTEIEDQNVPEDVKERGRRMLQMEEDFEEALAEGMREHLPDEDEDDE